MPRVPSSPRATLQLWNGASLSNHYDIRCAPHPRSTVSRLPIRQVPSDKAKWPRLGTPYRRSATYHMIISTISMIYIIAISKLSGRLGILTEQGESSQELQVVPFFRSVDKIQVAEVINKPEDTGNRGRRMRRSTTQITTPRLAVFAPQARQRPRCIPP